MKSNLYRYTLEKLHVISFDVPYPANYGGVIVVYHQLLAWKAAGIKVILHTYQYGTRKEQAHLKEICEEVHYYPRITGLRSMMSSLPYIVHSRNSSEMLDRLRGDKAPIFFEGVHTTAFISHPDLKDRSKAVRMHNVEWRYYKSLYDLTNNPIRRYYFSTESKRLKKYDAHVLKHADVLISISEKDHKYYSSRHDNCYYMPAPHGEKMDVHIGEGDYFLFHGKLSVADNKKSALYLMHNVFSKTNMNLIIAGLDPDKELLNAASKMSNVQVKANLTDADMRALIQHAQANILYTFQDNGLKLKLLHALHLGRHCIVNDLMVSNAPDLESLCEVVSSDAEFVGMVEKYRNEPFSEQMLEKRAAILTQKYDNLKNAKLALEFLKKHGFN